MVPNIQILANNCNVTKDKRFVDKIEAAQTQIQGALICFFSNDWISATTLAGAAENMLPRPNEEVDLFNFAKAQIAPILGIEEKKFIGQFNEQRDWLKHPQIHLAVNMQFSQIDAVIMLLRACTRFFAFTQTKPEEITIFENWVTNILVKNVQAQFASNDESLVQ